ncbi:MAG: hypothetical protein WAT29_08725 [Thiolinea sp.]
MKKLFFFVISLVLSIVLYGCNSKESRPIVEKPSLLLNQVSFNAKPTSIAVGDKTLLLVGEKRGLVLYDNGKEVILAKEQVGNQWLHYDGSNLYAFWWAVDEQKAKTLKVAVSTDKGKAFGTAHTLNTGTGVLPEISIASDGKGNIAIAYTDEREPGYGVYINHSKDKGVTWSKEDTRLDTSILTPAMLQDGNTKPATYANSPKLSFVKDKLIAIWQQVDMSQMSGYSLRIIAKTSLDQGGTWGKENNIFAAPNMQPVEMEMFASKDEVYVFAMFTEGNKGFTGFYNRDSEFANWGEISNAALGANFNYRLVSWVKGTFSGDNLILAFTSKPGEGVAGKIRADLAVLSTKSHTWLGSVKELDKDKGHNLTKATYPDIIDTGTGGVYVVWEDYRSIVPSIYLDISKDHGLTWLPKPKPITTPGLSVAKEPHLLMNSKELLLIYFLVVLDGQNPSGQRVYQVFPKEANGDFVLPDIKINVPDQEKLKTRLVERANKFWVLREERKWEETWKYMEPVYRERFNKQEWLGQQGRLSFYKTVVDESTIKINGNIAVLDANTEVSVNQQVSKEGVLESAPPNKQKVEMRWGWFYDDWYFMPNIIFGNHLEY